MILFYKRYLNQEQKIMNMGRKNISKEMIQMLIALPSKSWSKPSRYPVRMQCDGATDLTSDLMVRDCGSFVTAYIEYLRDGLQVPNDGLDAGLLHKRYAALLWKYGEAKAQKPYATDVKDPHDQSRIP
ncbi:hypothetical protein T459_01654 [Capsicum annuum]|uniref:Ubiquitin-like protease family profile domain-containing protein n=1 Tax=Capsicum annuum TaxID=4072 RepID=A0A2G3AHQ3_CAPAN|nr:hypothetical protein T459_01654 [Capsicum annuum]